MIDAVTLSLVALVLVASAGLVGLAVICPKALRHFF